MMNPISSPGDPIFFMHHAWLDRLWAKWQAEDPARLQDMGGNNKANRSMGMPQGQNPFGPGGPSGGPDDGMPGGMPMPGFVPVNMTRPFDVP